MSAYFSPPSSPEEHSNTQKYIPLLLILLLLALISSCIVGYILGKNTLPDSAGQIMDTFFLKQTDQPVESVFHLTGQILLSDGTPYANGIVQLHSEVQETRTDAQGHFSFFHVEKGTHTVSVIDENGSVLSECQIDLSTETDNAGVRIQEQSAGQYFVEIAADVRLLEVVLEIATDHSHLSLQSDRVTYVTSDGKVVTPTGEVSYLDGTVITPGGTVITTDGTIIVPNSSGSLGIAFITPGEEVIYPDKGTTLPDGSVISDAGAITLPNGTMITMHNGTRITTPEGLTILPEQSGVFISPDNSISHIGQTDSSSTAADSGSGAVSANNTGSSTSGSGSGGTTPSGEGSTNDPDNEPSVVPTPEPTGPIPNFSTGWTQGAQIDLFANRTDQSTTEKLLPGATGYYPFALENNNRFAIDYTLSVREGSLHIPMRFRIVEVGSTTQILTDWWTTQTQPAAESAVVRLPANETVRYYLEWEWPYESGSDLEDTRIGTDSDHIYTVHLSIHAEQVL